jgi:hypothetical protein
MRRSHRSHRSALSALVALALASASGTSVAGKKECAAAYVQAQQLKKEGSFKKAREQLIECSKNECLAAARKDCLAWLDEVNASIPSIVVAAKDPKGNDTFDVRVSDNDEVIAEKLDVNAIELDPGTHKLRFEYAGVEIEREVVLRQGEKNKAIEVSFAKDEPAKPVPAVDTGDDATADEPPPETASEGPPVLAYVLGGVGVVALAGAGFFWLSASSEEKDLEDSGCEPTCSDGDVDPIEQKRLFGDIALGVGIVAIGAAAYLYFSPRKKATPPPAAQLDLQMRPGGAFAGVSGRF